MDKQIPNAFENMSKAEGSKKRPGRPPNKSPVGESDSAKTAVGETKRKPVGLRGTRKTPTRKGYRRRWVNDIEDRIQMFLEGGYTPVASKDGTTRSRRAGNNVTSILMEIDEDLYKQDQEAKYKKWNQDNQERLKPREGAGYYQPKTKM